MKPQKTDLRKGLASLLTTAMLAGILPTGALAAEAVSFSDIQGHWGQQAITDVVNAGLFSGIDADTFDPDGSMTRGMFVSVLYRLSEKLDGPAPTGADASFQDVSADAWYAQAVSWAVKSGVTAGYSDTRFAPDELVTREQMCAFLIRFLNYMGYDLSGYQASGKFDDDAAISAWAKDAVYLSQALGLVKGVGGNVFNPSATATRASVAVIMDELMDKTDELVQPAKPTPTTKPSGGGGGGGGGSTTTALSGIYILRNEVDVTGAALHSGDELYTYVSPKDSVYSIRWLVGGVEKSSENVYTVSSLDVGQTITAEATGTGSYSGTVTSAATGKVVAQVDPGETDPDKSPVVVDEGAKFVNESGETIEIPADAVLSLDVTQSDEEVPEEESVKIQTAITNAYPEAEVTPELVTLDVDLSMSTEDGAEQKVHPVGETTVTLSREALGLASDADLSLYTFFASHTNKEGTEEAVPGEVVTIDGAEYIRFTLNGLSRIYIGNVPPLTVTFDTDGGTEIPSQKVKLGGYVKDVLPPVKDGWLFAGWDHDLAKENIIKDIKVTAIWVKGELAANEQLSGTWSTGVKPEEIEEPTVANGTVTIYVDPTVTYAANLSYTLTVSPVEGAVKAAVAPTAEAAMASTEYKEVSDAFPGIVAQVSDAEGKPLTSNEVLYIKWADAEGKVLGLQSARLVVRTAQDVPGDYDTQTRLETKDVNRGLGTVEYYLTGGKAGETVLPDFVGTVNGYLNSNWVDGVETYELHTYGSFYDIFQVSGSNVTEKNYTGLKIVVTPFAGETFSGVPEVSAEIYDNQTDEYETYPVSAALEDGKVVLTAAKPASEDIATVDITLTLNGVSQMLSVDFGGTSYTRKHYNTAVWSEALEILRGNEYTAVTYTGTEDVVLTEDLTLRPGQYLDLSSASLTVSARLTLEGDANQAANLSVDNGSLIVAKGGVLSTNSQSEQQNRYYNTNVNAEDGITVRSGGKVEVPQYGYLRLHSEKGGMHLDEGGSISSACMLYLDRNPESQVPNVFAGTVTISDTTSHQARVEVNDGLTLEPTARVFVEGTYARFDVYGGMTTQQGAVVESSGRVNINGRSENYGSFNVNGGSFSYQNTGYSTYNMGTITVASSARLVASGTVLVNSGSITGGGVLQCGEFNDVSSYDNGIEYVETGLDWNERTPANYDRYQFVRDPSATVDVIYFIGELSNLNDGSCDLTITK